MEQSFDFADAPYVAQGNEEKEEVVSQKIEEGKTFGKNITKVLSIRDVFLRSFSRVFQRGN